MRKQVPAIPEENYLIEPSPRGTASVVGFAAAVLKKRDPEAIMAVLPSDHFIRNQDLFHYLLRAAFDVARQNYLVTLGHRTALSIDSLWIYPAGRTFKWRVSNIQCIK